MTNEQYTPAQRFQLAAERMEMERKKLRGMSATLRIRGESTDAIMKEIMGLVCKSYSVTEEDLTGPSRLKPIAQARHAFCYLCVKLDPMITLKQVGNLVGRDHSTIINSIKKCDDLRLTDYYFAAGFNLCLDGIAESNSKYMQNLVKKKLDKDAQNIGNNELKKSVHALQVVHDFMLAMMAYDLRKQDGDESTDDLMKDLENITLKAMKHGF